MAMVIESPSERQVTVTIAAIDYLAAGHRGDAALDDAFGCTHDVLAVLRSKLRAGRPLLGPAPRLVERS